MSDFDEVLERLVADPSFAASLASDPCAASHGTRWTWTATGLDRD